MPSAERAQSFDRIAHDYDRYRPGYPDALIECVLDRTGLRPPAGILEIGSGTGQATSPFAHRGFHIVCIEPGKTLAAVAAEKLDQRLVSFETVRFEQWQEQPGHFDLAMSAQAFHWVEKPLGFHKVARALKDHCYFALFWHAHPPLDGPLGEAIQQAYAQHGPALAKRPYLGVEEDIEETVAEIDSSGDFGRVEVARFAWSWRYDIASYLGLISTYSDHATLPPPVRDELLQAIGSAIDCFGGYLEKPYITVLCLAQKRDRR